MPNEARVFPAGTGGNSLATHTIGKAVEGGGQVTTAQPPIRPPPDPFVLKSVEPFTDDDDIGGFVDGQGNRIWHVSSTASAKQITFMSVGESVDFEYVVKWVGGANAVTLVAAGGAQVGGTTTFALVTAGDAYTFRSDGIAYHLVAQATNQGFLTSNSFSAFTASASFGNITVNGSATFSGTAAFLTSINVSGTASINTLFVSLTAAVGTLVVGGTASFSATADFNAKVAVSGTLSVVGVITINGVPLTSDWAKIGSASISNALAMTFSGSWTSYSALRVEAAYLVSSGPNAELRLSSDNGTNYFLAGNAAQMPTEFVNYRRQVSGGATTNTSITFTISAATVVSVEMKAIGINVAPGVKYVAGAHLSHNGLLKLEGSATYSSTQNLLTFQHNATLLTMLVTATANAAQVNQVSFASRNKAGTTQTMSGGVIYLYGLK